ncbi:MAG: PTS system mannose/fructose/sorbose family transporter subunit IID [Firmicutes bacterium]|nr:PTS system mannose/fructose/sorbose family transporter subunit IID [Bacillota bacterium]
MPNNDKKRLSKEARSSMWRYILTLQWSWNYERMQALGFAWGILPILQKVNKSKDDLIGAVQRHLNFFNTHPPMGAAIMGAAVAMEEEGADGDAVDSLKVGLMGPFAGIGDTLYAILTRPLIFIFAADFALRGNILGFWLVVAFGIAWGIFAQLGLFKLGYQQGMNVVTEVSGSGRLARLTEGATIMGITVIGGFIPSILGITSALEWTQEVEIEGELTENVVRLQEVLDQILPYMIPLALVGLAYWLLKGRNWKPLQVLLALVVIAFVGSAVGFF